MDGGWRHQQRVAVGIAVGDERRADVGPGAWFVDDGERLFERGGQLVGHHARQNVGVAAGRERDHDLRGRDGIVALGRPMAADAMAKIETATPIKAARFIELLSDLTMDFKQESGHHNGRISAPPPCGRPSDQGC